MKKIFTLLSLLLCAVGAVNATITATWDFKSTASPRVSVAYEGSFGNVASNIADLEMLVDAQTGKFDTKGRPGDAQLNAGTVLYVPVVSTTDQITIKGNYSNTYTIGQETSSTTALDKTYDVKAADVQLGYVKITIDAQSYFYSIEATLAYMPGYMAGWNFSNSGADVTTVTGFSGTTTDQVTTKNGVVMTVNANGSTISNNGNSIHIGANPVSFKVNVYSTGDRIFVAGFPSHCSYTIGGGEPITAPVTRYDVTDADVTNGYVEIVCAADKYLMGIAVVQKPASIKQFEAVGWGTFTSSYALDFTNLGEAVKAYIVTGATGATVNKTQMTTTVPASTPLLLNAAEGTYAIPTAASSTTDVSANLLKKGTYVAYNNNAGFNYALSEDEGKATFKRIVSSFTPYIDADKAYLALKSDPGASARELLAIDGEATAIKNIKVGTEDNVYYDLQGRRILYPTKGLYIVNGKKVILK